MARGIHSKFRIAVVDLKPWKEIEDTQKLCCHCQEPEYICVNWHAYVTSGSCGVVVWCCIS